MSKERKHKSDIEVICEHCGGIYYVKPYQKDITRFCSLECRHKHEKGSRKGKWAKSTCPSCGKEFEFLASKPKKYCSTQCNKERLETKFEVSCDFCGKVFYLPRTRYQKILTGKQKHVACSKKCSNNLKLTGRIVDCAYCGKPFYVNGYRCKKDDLCCSTECAGKLVTQSALVKQICPNCNNEFESKRFLHQKFCSISCHNIYQKEHCTDERRVKSRDVALALLREGRFSGTNTRPQRIINKILEDSQINFQNEYTMGRYSIDNYLTDHALPIEVHGDYFHCNPSEYLNGPIYDMQKRRIKQDKAKHTYILNQYGVEILYLWESDIYKELNKCKKIIDLYISNNGILPEYNSFNWVLQEDELFLRENRIIPYQELKLLPKMAA